MKLFKYLFQKIRIFFETPYLIEFNNHNSIIDFKKPDGDMKRWHMDGRYEILSLKSFRKMGILEYRKLRKERRKEYIHNLPAQLPNCRSSMDFD